MEFLDKDFLLDTPTARQLYHGHAADMPIIDYHCHLSPREIAENRPFTSITQLWLGGDHYKWRAMRANGVDERLITGDADDRAKFKAWAKTVPCTMRNPLYIWTHMELRRVFDIDTVLNEDTADEIYEACNARLAQGDITPRKLMEMFDVECVCTTDDPIDSLEYHRQIAASGCRTKVLPAWRADKAHNFTDMKAWREYVGRLGEVAGCGITDYPSFIQALRTRHDFFADNGCVIADMGVSRLVASPCTPEEAGSLFGKALAGHDLDSMEKDRLATSIMLDLMRMNAEKDWAQQIHFGPLRNVSTRAARNLGPDTGFDTIGDMRGAEALATLLDCLDREGKLARTVLYNINPADNAWTAAMAGNFQDGSIPGKMQFGAAWWFNDHISGMREQLDMLSCQGLLSRFVGMLTDSRSFLSYPRHELFRRVLCSVVGADVERGLIPASEMPRVERMIEDICHNNAKEYFRI